MSRVQTDRGLTFEDTACTVRQVMAGGRKMEHLAFIVAGVCGRCGSRTGTHHRGISRRLLPSLCATWNGTGDGAHRSNPTVQPNGRVHARTRWPGSVGLDGDLTTWAQRGTGAPCGGPRHLRLARVLKAARHLCVKCKDCSGCLKRVAALGRQPDILTKGELATPSQAHRPGYSLRGEGGEGSRVPWAQVTDDRRRTEYVRTASDHTEGVW